MSDDALPSWSDLLALVERLEATDFEDFVVDMPGLTVRVSRHGLAEPAAGPTAEPAAVVAATPVEKAIGAASITESDTPDQPPVPPGGVEIVAPIVGLFYRRPAPDQPPFASVGDVVAVGATMAVIEVMKMMVPVEADVAGRVVAVLAENGEMVEDGRPLFVVDTTGST